MSKPSKASNEPFWWALFGAGGVVSAMFLPVLAVLFGLAIPLGWVETPDYQSMYALLSSPVTRFLLFGIISLCLFHMVIPAIIAPTIALPYVMTTISDSRCFSWSPS